MNHVLRCSIGLSDKDHNLSATPVADAETIAKLVEAKNKMGDDFPRIGVFVVSYAASELLRKTIERIPLQLRDVIDEIFVFDDHSPDDTFEIARQMIRDSEWREKLHVFQNPVNMGYGGNQKIGYRYAIEKGLDWVILLHGDGQYAPEHLPDLIAPIVDRQEKVIFGSRMIHKADALRGGMPVYKWIGNQVLTKFENFILDTGLSEFHTGYRVYATEVLKCIPFEENTDDFHFDSQIIIQLRALNVTIHEVPIKTFYGDETCHVNGLKYAKDVCRAVIGYRLHQLHIMRRSRYFVNKDFVYGRKYSPFSSHEQILAMIDKPGKCLDLGSSDGLLVDALREKNVHTLCVDIRPPESIKTDLDDYHQANLEDASSLNYKREYDYVILADVIEHIRNSNELLVKVQEFLKPDGRLILSTPNIAIWIYRLSLLMGRFNYGDKGILDRTHVHLYTLDSLKQAMTRAGYVITDVRVTSLPFEVVFESVGKSKLLAGIDKFYHRLCTFWKRMFAYQFVVEGKITRLNAETGEGRLEAEESSNP